MRRQDSMVLELNQINKKNKKNKNKNKKTIKQKKLQIDYTIKKKHKSKT